MEFFLGDAIGISILMALNRKRGYSHALSAQTITVFTEQTTSLGTKQSRS